MDLLIHEDDPAAAERAAQIALNRGQVIIYPTDTVYGLLAGTAFPDAHREIYRIKQRNLDRPLPLLATSSHPLSAETAAALAGRPELAASFGEGKLTVVLPAEMLPSLPNTVKTTQPGDIGIRCPASDPLLRVLAQVGGIAWGTSVNLAGRPACATQADVRCWIDSAGRLPGLAVLARQPGLGLPSAVVRYTPAGFTALR